MAAVKRARAESHLSWCRLLIIAYGNLPLADEALADENDPLPPRAKRWAVFIPSNNRTGYRACDWERHGRAAYRSFEKGPWKWAITSPTCEACRILEDAALELRASRLQRARDEHHEPEQMQPAPQLELLAGSWYGG